MRIGVISDPTTSILSKQRNRDTDKSFSWLVAMLVLQGRD